MAGVRRRHRRGCDPLRDARRGGRGGHSRREPPGPGLRELADLCAEVGSESVGVTLDAVNPLAVAEEPLEYARALGPLIKHVHLKDYRIYATPEGFRLVRCPLGSESWMFLGFSPCRRRPRPGRRSPSSSRPWKRGTSDSSRTTSGLDILPADLNGPYRSCGSANRSRGRPTRTGERHGSSVKTTKRSPAMRRPSSKRAWPSYAGCDASGSPAQRSADGRGQQVWPGRAPLQLIYITREHFNTQDCVSRVELG